MLIRNARLVPLTEPAPQGLVDVLVEDGVVTRVGAGLGDETAASGHAAYDDVVDAQGGWLMPGLWDQHVHLAQWTLSSARLDLAPARRPSRPSRWCASGWRSGPTCRSSAGATGRPRGTRSRSRPTSTPSTPSSRSC